MRDSGPTTIQQTHQSYPLTPQAPSLGILLWSCPAHLRPFVLSASEVVQHLLGDVPMPPLVGWLQERVDDWRVSLSFCAAVIGASTVLYLVGLGFIPGSMTPVMSVEVLDEDAAGLAAPLISNGSEYDFKRYWEEVEARIQRSGSGSTCDGLTSV